MGFRRMARRVTSIAKKPLQAAVKTAAKVPLVGQAVAASPAGKFAGVQSPTAGAAPAPAAMGDAAPARQWGRRM